MCLLIFITFTVFHFFADKRCSLPFPLGLAPVKQGNFRLAGEWLAVPNALAYNCTVIVAPVKKFYSKKPKDRAEPSAIKPFVV